MSRRSIKVKITDGFRSEASEAREAATEIRDFAKNYQWKKTVRSFFKKDKIKWWILFFLGITVTILFAVFHKKIVKVFAPLKNTVEKSSAPYWLIPVAVLIVLSIPPLFGHELVLLIVGLLWGLWEGFGIASAGTVLGEAMIFYLFKTFLRERALKVEEENIMYGCVARMMREGGIYIVTLVRLSIIPGHVVTAMQSTIGIPFWIYLLAIIITLPKQLVIVYLGVIFESSGDGKESTEEKLISYAVTALTILLTIISAYIIYTRARRYYKVVKKEMEARELQRISGGEYVPRPRSDTVSDESTLEAGNGYPLPPANDKLYQNNFSSSEVTLHPSMTDDETSKAGFGHSRNESEEQLIKNRPTTSNDGFVVLGRDQGYRDPFENNGPKIDMAQGVRFVPPQDVDKTPTQTPAEQSASYSRGGI